MSKNLIKGAVKNPNALHEDLRVLKGNKIPKVKIEKALKIPGKVGDKARLSENLAIINKSKGKQIRKNEKSKVR